MLVSQVVLSISVIILPIIVYGQYSSNSCESKETCRDCIQEINCVWCITPNDKKLSHCINKTSQVNDWCSQTLIVNPKSSQKILYNDQFSSDTSKPVQLKPQRIKLSLRKGEKAEIMFQYKQAENYPVDLYYIMDLSNSMEKHRMKLANLGVTLAKALESLSNNVRIGFGSFIDKVDLPFVSTVPAHLKTPCDNCASPYSFKNHLNLSPDYARFTNEVKKAKVSGNLDTPEGGFDAIMQAIVCKDLIGWRPNARHLLVFSTDAYFHIAGDGKLAGVIEPNDAKCHMINDSYTHYLKYDYPSVSQINYIAKENNINVIFAIVVKDDENVRNAYKMLTDRIDNANFGELGDRDNGNVVDLVITNYKKITNSITLTSNATGDVDVKLFPQCSNPKPNGCGNVHVGEIINFTATVQPLDCSNGGDNQKIISIKPDALEEDFIIELDVLCECPCSSTMDVTYRTNAKECSGQGDLECGVCKCVPGRFGKKCQCNNNAFSSDDTSNCKINNQTEICSGQGECKCGECVCNVRPKPGEKIYGKYCECNNYSCKREEGLLCSGKGTCDCGDCKCHAGYTGDACQCPDTNNTCIAPGSDQVCSGYGNCNCGQCECNVDGGHSGKFCEECTTCPAQRCEEIRHCVECQTYQTGLYDKDECQLNCTAFQTQIVERFTDDDNLKKCRVPDKAGCIIIFEYTYDENKELVVKAQKEKLCAGPPNVLAWILGVIGSILIAGLIMLIIWKVCTTIHDRREYAKFENERKALKWHRNENPLYKDATSTYANPVFNRSVSNASK